MNISDIIENFIQETVENCGGSAEIRRSELAIRFGCVPSQINYVITSRFTPEHGYIVESRRGGKGYIRITRINYDKPTAAMHIVNAIGDEISESDTALFLESLISRKLISKREAVLMSAATSDGCFREIPPQLRGRIRAAIFKHMLTSTLL